MDELQFCFAPSRHDRRPSAPEPAAMTDAPLTASNPAAAAPKHGVSLTQAFRVWLHVAALNFGGPAGYIAVMHRIIVDKKKSVGESRFLHALSYCMATGWRPPCRPT